MKTEYEGCVSVLRRELALVETIAAAQLQVRQAVLNREWADFEALMEDMARTGAEFEALEQERMEIFTPFAEQTNAAEAEPEIDPAAAVCNSTENINFYALVSRFPPEERKGVTELYRNLKLKTIQIRLENDALTNYLNGARAVVADFLEAAFPDRHGKIYSRQGTRIRADMRSMVLNRQL
ncbi:hypothetical protein AGMMS49991_06980 [Spirochaetia bacterium]|nr:hypothetical protein AGMMS49991_06980 [Spirochaetia bacterium]